nr:RNA-dependent RNA polymerase [Alternaria solani fusarivirus 1]
MLSAGLLSFVLFPAELLVKFLLVLLVSCFAALIVLILALWPVVLLSFYFFFPTPLVVFGVVSNLHFLSALMFFLIVWRTRAFVLRERHLIHLVGPKHALWVDSSGFIDSWRSKPFSWVAAAFDLDDVRISGQFQTKWLSKFVEPESYSNYYELTSLCWSQFIVDVHDRFLPGPRLALLATLWSLNLLLVAYLRPLKKMVSIFRYYVLSIFAILSLNPQAVLFLLGAVYHLLVKLINFFNPKFVEYLKWNVAAIAVYITNAFVEYNFVSRKWLSRAGFRPSRKTAGILPVFTNSVAKLAVVVADLGLPHYIMGGKQTYDADHIQETMDLMREAGWPINVELAPPSRFGSASAYADWLVSGTDWEQGIHNRKVYVDHALDPLRVKAVEFRRTEEYRSKENELESIARYFKSPKYDYPDLDLDDVWLVVGDIFRYSRITPMNYIIKMWEKKYALGSFMVDPNNPKKKHSRWKFIASMGYGNFKKLWRRTFEIAPQFAPVAHVSVKDEALPPRKYLADKLRTVVGSPIGQYIMSTVWNYSPNHNFRWTSTPIKVGMPLNGYWMDYVYTAHSRCQIHYAGDMSEFDSTLSGPVLSLIAAVRKKGFESHKDRDRIARLIDINYQQVASQLLNTTSTGDIYSKGTGLTTGHSSTSMDNSVGLVILYLMAWKEITGLSAQEFKHYNELSCFGDDHFFSSTGNKPAAWNFRSIQSVMRKWGITNNLEATGPLTNIGFLSKYVRVPTPADVADFQRAGVKQPRWAVFHDKEKLVGKMVAKVKSQAPEYRLKRLVSYLSLTAHHRDIYDQVNGIIKRTTTFKPYLKSKTNPKGIVVPSYDKVVSDWYKPDANFPENMVDEVASEFATDKTVLVYGNPSALDSILGALALVPDFVNPAVFNMGYMATLQSKLFKCVSWPMQLLSLSNGAVSPAELSHIARKTVYEFLDPSLTTFRGDEVNISTLLVRHWIFLFWKTQPSFVKMPQPPLASIARKIASLQFSVNGKVFLDSKRFNFQILDLLVVALLDFLYIPDLFPFASVIALPDVNLLSEQLTFFIQNLFWSALPPNYADVTPHLRSLTSKDILVISAPTGSGKSTSLISHINNVVGHKYNKIIVVEPRSAIVRTIVPYVRVSLSLPASGATSGMTLDTEEKIWYVTAQELLLHPYWYKGQNSNNLFVLDECHIDEPAYQLAKTVLLTSKVDKIFVSATPDYSQFGGSNVVDVPLVSARLFNVHVSNVINEDVLTKNDFTRHYVSETLAVLQSRPAASVSLVFCTTLGMCKQFSELCHKRNFILSSGTSELPDLTAGTVIFTTSVADVGITLPNVDFVVTSDIGFTVAHNLDESKERYYKLTEGDLKQRVGRTGRTNNGAAVVFRTPNARFVSDLATVRESSSVFDLIAGGVPLDTISELKPKELKKLLGLDEVQDARAAATLEHSLSELKRFQSNIQPLLEQRAKLMEIGTNDGSQPRYIDSARMGVLLQSTNLDSSSIIRTIVKLASHLGLKHTAAADEANALDVSIEECKKVLRDNGLNIDFGYSSFLSAVSQGAPGMNANINAFLARRRGRGR